MEPTFVRIRSNAFNKVLGPDPTLPQMYHFFYEHGWGEGTFDVYKAITLGGYWWIIDHPRDMEDEECFDFLQRIGVESPH